ncbi:MAG TPA: helix-turn-helix domain-containing protein [Solirubrobacterales bacterium]|nr:helix-turn-helix domain-containing protein [Solirubrobacterales bacterium]
MAQRTSMRPPPGRQRISREFIAQHQRLRIVNALAEEIRERGYRAVTVADVVRRAGVARNTFYDNFSSKEDCFLATQDYAVEEALQRVVEAGAEAEGWEDRLAAGLGAFLGYVASKPALARSCIVEALSAGEAAQGRHEESLQAFVPLLRGGREASPYDLPDTLEETIAGGIFWVVYQRIVRDQTDRIEALLPDLLDFALTPYIGAESAQRATARL